MSIKKLQTTLVQIAEGPVGGIILGAFLIGALILFAFAAPQDIPFIYQQF